jgi:MFS family permease
VTFPSAGPEPPREPHSRSFWLFWSASTISRTGDAITSVALPLTAITVLHSSSFEVSLLTAATFAAWVVIGLPAGAIVHRLPLQRVQVLCDLVRGAALISVPIAAWTGVLSLAQLLGAALVVSFVTVIFDVANSTFIVSVASKEELTSRNSLVSGAEAVTQTGGPSLGGLLVKLLGAGGAIAFDAGSYLISALLLSYVPRRDQRIEEQPLPVRQAVHDGWHFVVHHPVIGPGAAMAMSINFVCGAFMALGPLFLLRTLHTPVALVGLLLSAEGLGTLIGAAVTKRLALRVGSARLLLRATGIGGVFALLIPLASDGGGLLLFAVGNTGFAAGVVIFSILARTNRQEASPPELLPRVMATVRFLSWGVVPLGALMAGALAGPLGIRGTLAVFSVLSLAVPAIGATSQIRRLYDLTGDQLT